MDLLRFITAGSVDDGKSTLIGRLLYDSKNILVDQLEQLEIQSAKRNFAGGVDLALLTDGLRAEREQGITIDVAYRYFSTPKRKFIIADAPGHIQYTRNMVTGASNSELIIILIDARQGVVEQTRRHSIIASLLKMPHVAVAINKMDLVGYDEQVFRQIVQEYETVARQLGLTNVHFFPISALEGDNVVDPSSSMPWYTGPSLLQHLEEVEVIAHSNQDLPRFQVQYVLRPQRPELHDYRGYAGRVLSGSYQTGDAIQVLPSGRSSSIARLEIAGVEVPALHAGQSGVILLADDIDVSRGDSLVKPDKAPSVTQTIEALLCWLDDKPLVSGNKYLLRHHAHEVKTVVKQLHYRLDVNSLEHQEPSGDVKLNEVVYATLRTASPVAVDVFDQLSSNATAILVDETSNSTVAAVLIRAVP